MTRQQIHRTNQAKNDNSSAGGIFQRAAVHYVEAKELQQDEVSNTESLPVIQPKLKIGAVGDKYEQEADRVARQVVSQVNASTGQAVQGEVVPQEEDEQLRMTPIVQRQLGTDTDETEQKIAKNQENNLISIDVNQYPANAGIIQRFKDPETDEEVNIAEIKYYGKVLDYLKLIQEKKLRVTVGEFRDLIFKKQELSATIGEQIKASNIEGMEQANAEDAGLKYYHRVSQEDIEANEEEVESYLYETNDTMNDDQIAELISKEKNFEIGYANPNYFERLSKFTWRLRPKVSASKGIKEFINPSKGKTIIECQATAQAIFYHTILNAIGSEKFDATFGSQEVDILPSKRLLIQMDMDSKNPLNNYLEDFKPGLDADETVELEIDEKMALSNKPNSRPAKVGGWYYIKNHQLYNIRHSQGIWGGENVIYTGRNEGGNHVFSGFGLSNRTEKEMAEYLADEFNAPPSAEEIELICLRPPQYLSLALPVLGDLSSIQSIPTLTQKTLQRLQVLWNHQGKKQLPELKNLPGHEQNIAKIFLIELLIGTTLQQPITRSDILTTFKLSEISNKSQELPVEIGRWETGLSHISLTWTNSSIKKTTIHNILDIFCKKYNLINRPELIPIFQKLNNKDVGAKTNFDVKQNDIFLFPLPSRISKFYNVAGGFQSVGSKILSEDKIKQLGGIT
jgi:hypothetical protein